MKTSPHSSVSRKQLRTIPVPKVRPYAAPGNETVAWEPIQHGKLADTLTAAIRSKGVKLVWEWYVVRNGYGVIGVGIPEQLEFHDPGVGWVVRHSNDGFWKLKVMPATVWGGAVLSVHQSLAAHSNTSSLQSDCDELASEIARDHHGRKAIFDRVLKSETSIEIAAFQIAEMSATFGAFPWRYARIAFEHLHQMQDDVCGDLQSCHTLMAVAKGNKGRSPVDRIETAVNVATYFG